MSIRISRLAKIRELRKGLIICIEGKGVFKHIHCIANNAALFVDLS